MNDGDLNAQEQDEKKGWKSKVVKWVVLMGVPFIIGTMVGGDGDASSAAQTADQPVKTVTVDQPAKTVTKEVPGETVEVEVASQMCLTALDNADSVIAVAGEGFTISSEAFYAASEFDVEGVEAAATKLDAIVPDLEAAMSLYGKSSSACRSGVN